MEYYVQQNSDVLYHWGIKGMKWGVRRYQNKDGSLTPAGQKRRARLEGKLEKLGGNKKAPTNDDAVETVKAKSASDMSDKELQDRVNRLRNEDAYRDLSKKLGYDGPKTELDAKIADMEKQKRYLELQRDINNLTPKKVSMGKKILDSIVNDVIAPAAKKAGKEYLEKYLSSAVTDAMKKTAKEQSSKIGSTVKKAAEKAEKQEADKQAKKEAKQQAKAEKQAAKESKKSSNGSDDIKFTVEGEGTSSRSSSSSTKKRTGGVVDMESWPALNSGVTSVSTKNNTSNGRTYVSGYLNDPVSGLLPAPKDDR